MPTINGRVCVVNGTPVDKVFSNGQQVYGRNLLISTSSSSTNGQTTIHGSSADKTGYISGLFPINLLDNPNEDVQTYPTYNGEWGKTNWTATLSKGVYCFSVDVLSNTQSVVSGRCEFGTGKSVDFISNGTNQWGFAGDNNINPQSSGLITLAFKVTQDGTFRFGLSGYPWNGGEVTFRHPMLNAGSVPLPFTMNKLEDGAQVSADQMASDQVLGGIYSRTDSYEQVTADPVSSEFYYRFVLPNTNNLYGLIPGETYTLSGSASHTVGELKFRAQYSTNGSNWNVPDDLVDLGIPISDGSVFTPFSHTFTIPAGATGVYISLENYDHTDGSLFRFKNMKLEKGATATPWTPAPEDVGVK